MSKKAILQSVDDYLDGLTLEQRTVLQQIRQTIHRMIRGTEESISYGMPAFKYRGKWLIHLGAAKNHCALYGVSLLANELKGYDLSGKGTLRFNPNQPPPQLLIKKILTARVHTIDRQIAGSASARSRGAK